MLQGTLYVKLAKASFLRNTEVLGKMDPYVVMTYKGKKYKTNTAKDAGKEPVWNQVFKIAIHPSDKDEILTFDCLDSDMITDDKIGSASLHLSEVCQDHKQQSKTLNLTYKTDKPAGELLIDTKYVRTPSKTKSDVEIPSS